MDKEILKTFVTSIAKQGMTAIGLYLGFTGTQETQFVGAGMVLVSLGCEWWDARGRNQFIAILAKLKPVASPGASTADAVKAAKVAVAEEQAK